MSNICWCGEHASYPHHFSCPFPYFGENPRITAKWLFMRRVLMRRYKNTPKPSGMCPVCGTHVFLINLTDDRLNPQLIGSCDHIFTYEQWMDFDIDAYASSEFRDNPEAKPTHLDTKGGS